MTKGKITVEDLSQMIVHGVAVAVAVVDRIISPSKITIVQRLITVVDAVDVRITANPKPHLDDKSPIMISINRRKIPTCHAKISKHPRIRRFIGNEISPIAITNNNVVRLEITTLAMNRDDHQDRFMKGMLVTRRETHAEEKFVLHGTRTTMNLHVVKHRITIAMKNQHKASKETGEVQLLAFLLKHRASNVQNVTRTCVATPRVPPNNSHSITNNTNTTITNNNSLRYQCNPTKINVRITSNQVRKTLVSLFRMEAPFVLDDLGHWQPLPTQNYTAPPQQQQQQQQQPAPQQMIPSQMYQQQQQPPMPSQPYYGHPTFQQGSQYPPMNYQQGPMTRQVGLS